MGIRIEPIESALLLWVEVDPDDEDDITPLTGLYIHSGNFSEVHQFTQLVKSASSDWRDIKFLVFPFVQTDMRGGEYVEVLTTLMSRFEERDTLFPNSFLLSAEDLICMYQ